MQYIDLSQDIKCNMPVYPGDVEVSLTQVKKLVKDEYNAYSLYTGMHAGTHMDCPMHLLPEEKSIAEYPIENFIGNGVLIDARNQSEIGMKAEYEEKIKNGDIVLIYTEVDEHYGKHKYYLKHPAITKELAAFLVSKRIKLLGMDMPSPDYPPFEVHKLLLSNNIFIMENVTNLKGLLNINKFEVFAMPLKIHAEASLVRAFARYD